MKEENENKDKKANTKFKNEGGIDLSRVINKDYLQSLGEFYKCSICSKIMVNPTDCESCGHSFCNECISKSKCPFGCEKKSFKPASMGIRNLLNNLKFNCPNKGCNETILYIDVKTHDNICPFQKMICPNKECEDQLLKKDLENHIKNTCKYTMIKCSYCNYKFPRCQIQEHEKVCSVAYQSFNSSSGNMLNLSNNNSTPNIHNINNKQTEAAKVDSNQYIQTLSKNITQILKDNNMLLNNSNSNSNINNDINANNKDHNENNDNNDIDENIDDNNINIIDSNNNNGKKASLSTKNSNNINTNSNSNANSNNINNIFNSNANSNKNNNIFNTNDNQNESIENNNELSRLSFRQSLAQIEEDDLIDILKKAIEEKLNERFLSFDTNFDKLMKDIKTIKTFVCRINPIDDNKDLYENDNDDEENNRRKKKNNENDDNAKLNNIKEYLKEIVEKAEKEINTSIKSLNDEINKEIENNKNQIKKKSDNDINNDIKNDNKDNEKNEIIINEINKKIDEITNKIIESLNETNSEINNINQKMKNDIGKIIPETESINKEEKNRNDEDNNKDKDKNNKKNDADNTYENMISNLENIFRKVIEDRNNEHSKNIMKIIDEKIKNNNNNNNNDINIDKNKENNEDKKMPNDINDKFNSLNNDINNVNGELKIIKTNIKEVITLISEQFIDITNLLSNNSNPTNNNNINNSNNINPNLNNNTMIDIKKIEEEKDLSNSNAYKLIKSNINDFSFKASDDKVLESPKKIVKIQHDNSEPLIHVNEKLKKNLIKKNLSNKKLAKKNIGNIITLNNDESFDSLAKENDDENKLQDSSNKVKAMNILNGLDSKISLLDKYAKTIPDLIKDKIGTNLENHILNLGKKIEDDLDKKINNMFGLKYCIECDKVDYFYGFMKCSICLKDNCKQCISVCLKCKLLVCKKCCNCPGCKKIYCLNCRYLCEQCNKKFCINCLSNCNTCSKHICIICLKKCIMCQTSNCDLCSKNCYICLKNICNKCSSFKNCDNFLVCPICNKSICTECKIECESCNEKICKNCYFECEQCKKKTCFYCSKKCGLCDKKYCTKCALDFEKTKCNICNKIFCYNCISNIVKCKKCNKTICKECYIQCFQCKSVICKKCSKKCSNCNNRICSKCQYKCICGMVIFCGKCLLSNEELCPHECTQFINDSSIFNSIKTRSIKKLNKNFEAKFFLDKKSSKGRTLIGVTDMDENLFENDTREEILGIWTLVLGSGEKYSSEKKLESYLDSDVKEKDFIYIMKKDDKLFFRINNDEYKLAFNLPKNDYFIYLENINEKHCSAIKFIFIREYEENK